MVDFLPLQLVLGACVPPQDSSLEEPQDILQHIVGELDSQALEKHVRELSGIGERVAYSEDTTNIDRARDYIVFSLRQDGLTETGNPVQKGFYVQRFTMQTITEQLPHRLNRWAILEPLLAERPVSDLSDETEIPTSKLGDLSNEEQIARHNEPLEERIARLSKFLEKKDFKQFELREPILSYREEYGIKAEGGNIIVTIPGRTHPHKKVILGAHYDCANGPGANDNGTGVAALLEAARIFAGHNFEYTIEIVFFTSEEQPCADCGSKLYLKEMLQTDKNNILGVYIIDQIGNNSSPGEPQAAEDLDFLYDRSNPEIPQPLINATRTAISAYVPDLQVVSSPDSGCDSDDDEFQREGIPTILVSEDTTAELRNQNTHMNTPNDVPENIDFDVFFPQATKAVLVSVAAVAIPTN